MPYFRRRSPRLPRFDYATPGAYFVTVVTFRRRSLLGEIVAGESVLNAAGQMIADTWATIPVRHSHVDVDAFVVMPNHIHGLLWLTPMGGSPNASLPAVIGAFKSLTTCRYIDGVKQRDWPAFERHLWQRSYYDRIVRDEAELKAYREYIATNPLRWTLDRKFPAGAP